MTPRARARRALLPFEAVAALGALIERIRAALIGLENEQRDLEKRLLNFLDPAARWARDTEGDD